MGKVHLIICILSTVILYEESRVLFILSLINSIFNFWSFGIMHNFKSYPLNAPNSWTVINFITSVAGIIFLIISIILGIEVYKP